MSPVWSSSHFKHVQEPDAMDLRSSSALASIRLPRHFWSILPAFRLNLSYGCYIMNYGYYIIIDGVIASLQFETPFVRPVKIIVLFFHKFSNHLKCTP